MLQHKEYLPATKHSTQRMVWWHKKIMLARAIINQACTCLHVHVHALVKLCCERESMVILSYSEKMSGWAKKSAYISSNDRFSRIKVGSTIRVRSMPTRTWDSMCIITLLLAAIPSVSEWVRECEQLTCLVYEIHFVLPAPPPPPLSLSPEASLSSIKSESSSISSGSFSATGILMLLGSSTRVVGQAPPSSTLSASKNSSESTSLLQERDREGRERQIERMRKENGEMAALGGMYPHQSFLIHFNVKSILKTEQSLSS